MPAREQTSIKVDPNSKKKKLDNFYAGIGLSSGMISDRTIQEVKANKVDIKK